MKSEKMERKRERDDLAVFVNTLEECSLMLVHNWTTVPRPPAHTNPWIYQILSFEPVTEQHGHTLHNKSVRVCVCVFAALLVKDRIGRQKHSGRGVTLHERSRRQVFMSAPLYRTIQECPVEREENTTKL